MTIWMTKPALYWENDRKKKLTVYKMNFLCVDFFFPSGNFLFSNDAEKTFWSNRAADKPHTIKLFISLWAVPFYQSRCWDTALAWLCIGYTFLTHSYLMSHSDPPLWSSCSVSLLISHILLSCPCLTATHTSAFPHLSSLPDPSVLDILSESPTSPFDNFFSPTPMHKYSAFDLTALHPSLFSPLKHLLILNPISSPLYPCHYHTAL